MEQTAIQLPQQILMDYKKSGDMELRNELVMHYLYIVRTLARRLAGSAPGCSVEDMVNQGVLALMDCLDKYDFTRDTKFETYAYLRVRGALIDYIRRQDWIPHRIRRMKKQMDEAYFALANEQMGEPALSDLAGFMDVPEDTLQNCIQVMDHAAVLSFEELLDHITGTAAGNEPESKDMTGRPEDELLAGETRQVLADAIDGLSARERTVISLYYYEELKYAEIASVMEISESRVCQLHSRAVSKLKNTLENYLRG